MNTRNQILANIRRSLGRQSSLPEEQKSSLLDRLDERNRHALPVVEGDLVLFMKKKMQAVLMDVVEVDSRQRVAAAVEQYLEEKKVEPVITISPSVDDIEWSENIHVNHRIVDKDDKVSVTSCYAAIAETGSIVVVSSRLTPVNHNFLPDIHIVIVEENQIVRNIEDIWLRMRQENQSIPRFACLITGPSRTADIEQTIEIGAHGPVHMLAVLVRESPAGR